MFKNYILVILRSLARNKIYASINIFGLAIGLASCLAIFFYVQKEFSYDEFHSRKDRIYKVTNSFERTSRTDHWLRTPPALAPAMRNTIPGVEKVTRLRLADGHIFSVGENSFRNDNVFYADSLFLEMFDFPLRLGDPFTALDHPGNIVISESTAALFFGEQDPIGRYVTLDNDRTLEVTGVLKDISFNSHIQFDMLISFPTYVVPDGYLANLNSWAWAGFHTYIQTFENADLQNIESKIAELFTQNYNRPNVQVSNEILPLTSLYFYSGRYSNLGRSINTGDVSTIYALIAIAILILILAGFNFMNLSTAISLGRAREIGVRKVMGAGKRKIAFQFLTESIVLGLISLLIAFMLVVLSQPYFFEYLALELPTGLSNYLGLIPLFLIATIFIGLMAGLYPSAVLSRFDPIMALKGDLKTGKSGVVLRKGMLIFQFAISLFLIIASVIVVQQMDFVREKSLGFEKENIVRLTILESDMEKHFKTLKNRLEQYPEVMSVTMSSHAFAGSSSQGPARPSGVAEDESYQLNYYQTGYDFLKVTGVRLLEGRYFSKDFISDSTAVVLNQSAVRVLGLEQPLGKKMDFNMRNRTIIGVVEDFHFNSLHNPVSPMAIVMPFTTLDNLLVKLAPGNVGNSLKLLQREWGEIVGNAPFTASFVDDDIQRMYEKDQKMSSLVSLASVLAILLSCLGLYGVVAFSVRTKLKEIGIRKVLGASLSKLLSLLGGHYLLLVVLASIVAWPVAYIFANGWLDNFSYRIPIGISVFVFSTVILILIAVLTICYEIVKAALTNPVDVLRNE